MEVLFITCTEQIDMGFVACYNEIISFGMDESKNFSNTTSLFSQIIFSKILYILKQMEIATLFQVGKFENLNKEANWTKLDEVRVIEVRFVTHTVAIIHEYHT